MSLQLLLVPNNYNLNAGTLTANTINGTIIGSASNVTGPITNNLTFQGNLYLQRYPSGTDYRNLSIDAGNSLGYLYANFQALGDGLHLSYNVYYPAGGTTPFIQNTGSGTSDIGLSGSISFSTGVMNTAPTTKFTISSTGVLTASNGGTYNGPVNTSSLLTTSNATNSSNSTDTSASISTAGGLSVAKTINANAVNASVIGTSALSNIGAGLTFTNATSGYVPSTLSYYETGSLNVTYGGPILNVGGTIAFTRIGNSITLKFTGLQQSATTAATLTITPVLPTRLIPTSLVNNLNNIITVQNGGTYGVGSISITSSGAMTVYGNASLGTFAASGATGFLDFAINYTL